MSSTRDPGANRDATAPWGSPERRTAEAISAHHRGWALTPLRGKQPILKGWNARAVPSLDEITGWANQGNVGLRTGAISGVVVLDDDTDDASGVALLELPPTPTVITGSGRRHFYFRAPPTSLGNSVGKVADRVDTRGDGGQVVFPGSIHPETGRAYRWAEGRSPDEVELAELPTQVLERLARPARAERATITSATTLGVKLLEREASAVRNAAEGERNDTLNRAAFTIGGAIAAGMLERSCAEAALQSAAESAGLKAGECVATIRSGIDAGLAKPLRTTGSASSSEEEQGQPSSASEALAEQRPTIKLGPNQHQVLDRLEMVLGEGDEPALFNRGGVLVRVIRVPVESNEGGVTRPLGLVVVIPVDPPALCDIMNQRATFTRVRKNGDDWVNVQVAAPIALARELIARRQWTHIPPLHGLLAGPTILRDGLILAKDGYHREGGLYVDLDGLCLPAIDDEPTEKQARAALTTLKEFYRTLPFVSDADRSVALAATFTPLARTCFAHTPLFGASAPSIGTGKSLLCDTVTVIATGRTAAAMSQAKDEDENRKLFLALLMESSQVLLIDNCTRPISSPSLCSILSQQFTRGRILGSSATVVVPTTHATFFASGNNLVIEGDMRRRALVCMLDAKDDRPWEREFARDLRDIARDRRVELLVAALTVLRWRLRTAKQLRPVKLKPLGGFEGWSRVVREALVLLGEPDPLVVLARNEASDPETADLAALHGAWRSTFGTEQVSTAQVAQVAKCDDVLKQALAGAGCVERADTINSKRLGKYLAKHANRRVDGRWFEKSGDRGHAARWRLAEGATPERRGFEEFEEFAPSPTREAGEIPHVFGGGEQTHETPQTQAQVEDLRGFDQPCAACGATDWWEESASATWVCRRCQSPLGPVDVDARESEVLSSVANHPRVDRGGAA